MNQQSFPFMGNLSQLDEGPEIPGYTYISEFLSQDEAKALYCWLDSQPSEVWMRDLSRRVIHYGWRYDYTNRKISSDLYIGPLPERCAALAERIHRETGKFQEIPNQVIVNEYEPGQGIAMHTDHPDFGPTVAMISLGDSWSMDFLHEQTGRK